MMLPSSCSHLRVIASTNGVESDVIGRVTLRRCGPKFDVVVPGELLFDGGAGT